MEEQQTASVTPETAEKASRKFLPGCKKNLDTILAVLVAVYSLLTAGTAYAASIEESNQEESYFVGLSRLSDANFFYTRANQRIQLDYQIWGDMNIEMARAEAEGQLQYMSDVIFGNLYGQLSSSAQASFDRWDSAVSDIPFDVQYGVEMYDAAEMNQTEADAAFEAAQIHGAMSNRLELVMLMLAVGLSFTAWASVTQRDTLRLVFTAGAIVILVVNSCMLAAIGMGIV